MSQFINCKISKRGSGFEATETPNYNLKDIKRVKINYMPNKLMKKGLNNLSDFKVLD
ncbi:hypothetical protein [Psychroflexus salis]|uniref:Uncharacterized protein n=1 Tax=Psychroflexus salis TaxID=1526574 RepID=A0A917EC99_9FLAO|nr:hypothetical protein [Psychroflexus salis]GGE23173.1 hypothetical protein GCM10010831_25100 [Psychroflexus salis]